MPRKKTNKKYKLKTHKSTAKRFRVTGSGKIVRTKGGQSHFRRRRSARSKRLYSKMVPVSGSGYIKRIRRLAPYMNKYRTTPTARTAK
ncbi:MAG: 50S ribosomal protein L35 [Anaerolineales bacterium]|jgi:large subunit ribosomal protein L35